MVSLTSSHIRYISADDESNDGNLRREGQLMVLLPLSRKIPEEELRELQEFRVYVELSAFLAYKHIQSRSGQVLSELPSRLEGCDFSWKYRHHDTQFSPLQAARELLSYQKNMKRPIVDAEASEEESEFAADQETPFPSSSEGEPAADFSQDIVGNMTPAEHNSSSGSQTQAPIGNSSTPTPFSITPGDQPDNSVRVRTVPPTVSSAATGPAPFRTIPPREHLPHTPAPRTRQLQNNDQDRHQYQQHPFAVVGAARSVVSQAVSILGSASELPQISSSSTASILDDSPFFARTVPTNQGDAHACMVYLSRLGVTHLGVLFIKDSWGRRYEQDIQYYAKLYGIVVYSVSYEDESESNLDRAMHQLKQSDLRYFVAIINPSSWKKVIQKAFDIGIMGNEDYHWLIGDLVELVGDSFSLDRETEGDIASALHGTGVVFLQVTPHEAFDQALSEFTQDVALQQEFIASHSEPYLLDNFTFSPSPGRSLFQYLTYDAVVALGITACDTPGLFTGAQFYSNLLEVDFEGVSGRVNLHEKTGTRLGDNMRYQVVNMILDDYQTGANLTGDITFTAEASSTIELSPPNASEPIVEVLRPFVYHDNTTIPPMVLPSLDEERNLIPKGGLVFGLSLAGIVMILSLFYGLWVLKNRETYVIRASQPIFLVQLCIGTFVIASTIIPMSFQEDMPGLDIACMSVPWLFGIGFTVAISALFTKARRINQLLNSGIAFRRAKIKAQHVMRPFIVMLSINLLLLTAWSASPWRLSWHRIDSDNSYDEFGRSVNSYGVCRAKGKLHFLFSVPLVLTNIIILFLATWQTYKAKDLPSEFSETHYLVFTMVGLTETFIIGISIIFVVIDHPPAFFLVSSVLICIGCLSILLPVFVPKFKLRHFVSEPQGRRRMSAITLRTSTVDRRNSAFGSTFSMATNTVHSQSALRNSSHSNSLSAHQGMGGSSSANGSGISLGSQHQHQRGQSRRSSDLGPYGVSRLHRTHVRKSSDPFGSSSTQQPAHYMTTLTSPPLHLTSPPSMYPTTLHTHEETTHEETQRQESSSSLGSEET